MPPRDPTVLQLDFPLLVADLIEQLRLTGTMGLLNFLPEVRPTFIVGSREGALSITERAPVFASAEIFSGFNAAPAVNVVVVDTGALPAGDYDVFAAINFNGPGLGQGHIDLEHRNAANAATLSVPLSISMSGFNNEEANVDLPVIGQRLALNERLRVRLILFGISGSCTAVIGARIRTTP